MKEFTRVFLSTIFLITLAFGYAFQSSKVSLAQGMDDATKLDQQAIQLYQNGHYAEAALLYQRLLVIQEKTLGPDHPEVATTLSNLASLYKKQGRYAEAEPLLKRSLSIDEKALGPNHAEIATTLNNLAGLYRDQGRYAEAEPLFKRSLSIDEKALGPDHPDLAITLHNLAELYRDQSRYAEAEPLYKRSLAIGEKALGPDSSSVATKLNDLGLLYSAQGRNAEAQLLLSRALVIKEKADGPDHPDVASVLLGLAQLSHKQGRYVEAETLDKRALGIFEKALGPDHPNSATALNNLAEVYRFQGGYAEAETLYKRSLAAKERKLGPDHPSVATVLDNLGSLYYDQGRYAEAEPFYIRSLAIRERALGPDHPSVALSINSLALTYANQGLFSNAITLVNRAVSGGFAQKGIALPILINSRTKGLIAGERAFDDSLRVIQQTSQTTAAVALNQLSVRFSAASNSLAQLVRKDQDLTAEAQRLDEVIVEAVSKEGSKRDNIAEQLIKNRLNEVAKQKNDLQSVFTRDFPNYVALSKPQPLTAREIRSLIDSDEALIVIDLDENSFVWIVTKESLAWTVIPISAEQASKAVESLRVALNPESSKPYDRALAYRLYQQLLGPVEDIISKKQRLSLVLGGALTSLPPQVLITSDPNGKGLKDLDWLVRKYAITVYPSVGSLKVLRDRKMIASSKKPMIGFGDPILDKTIQAKSTQVTVALSRSVTSFYRGVTTDTKSLATALPPLPETADELRAIAKILKADAKDIKLGELATVTAVKKEALDAYRVIYFATHALVAGEVAQFAKVKAEPALVLSMPDKPSETDDGLLRASEVAMLKLDADFVVLSACNTAAGDKPGAEALSGLARAFFYAGARSLLVSHWTVDSDSAVALMTRLFQVLKKNPKLSHAQALQKSMLEVMTDSSKPDWEQPKFWGPFVIVGEPRPRAR